MMNNNCYEAYVLKYQDKYLKFGSYRKARAVDNFLNASLYSKKNLAEKRLSYAYIDGKQVSSFKIFKVMVLTSTEAEA